jgi:hypothetical protein
MFWRKPTFQDPQLGTLTFSGGQWLSKPIASTTGNILVTVDGDSSSPSENGLAMAREVMSNPDRSANAAKNFVQAQATACEFIKGHGVLVLDGFSFKSAAGTFDIEFGLSAWSDAMISVVFRDGSPCDILLAD